MQQIIRKPTFLGGSCSGENCLGGSYLRDNRPRDNYLGSNCLGPTIRGQSSRRQCSEEQLSGGNFPRGQLSWGQSSRGQLLKEGAQFSLGAIVRTPILKLWFYFYYYVKPFYWNRCYLFVVRFYEFFSNLKTRHQIIQHNRVCLYKCFLIENQVQEEETMSAFTCNRDEISSRDEKNSV